MRVFVCLSAWKFLHSNLYFPIYSFQSIDTETYVRDITLIFLLDVAYENNFRKNWILIEACNVSFQPGGNSSKPFCCVVGCVATCRYNVAYSNAVEGEDWQKAPSPLSMINYCWHAIVTCYCVTLSNNYIYTLSVLKWLLINNGTIIPGFPYCYCI